MDGITIYVTDNGHQIIYEPVILFQLSECKMVDLGIWPFNTMDVVCVGENANWAKWNIKTRRYNGTWWWWSIQHKEWSDHVTIALTNAGNANRNTPQSDHLKMQFQMKCTLLMQAQWEKVMISADKSDDTLSEKD